MTHANTNTAPTTTVATQRPVYAGTGRRTHWIALLASTVFSTVLLGSVVIGMTAPASVSESA